MRTLLLLFLPAALMAQQRDSAELVRLESVWNDAHLHGDTVALKSLWSDVIVVIVPEMPVFSKQDMLAFWRSGRSSITRYETSDLHVRRYGDAAVVEGRMKRTRDFNGRVVDDDWRFTKAYVKRSGRWQVASYHASIVPATRTAGPTNVTIVGDDYAFIRPPATLPPGETLFAFENHGKVRHEMNLALLKPGVALQDVLRTITEGGQRRNLIEKSIGILIAAPADTSGGRVSARLLPGRMYVLLCVLRDTPDAQPHVALGMIAAISVSER